MRPFAPVVWLLSIGAWCSCAAPAHVTPPPEPAMSHDVSAPNDGAPACHPSRFDRSSDGFTWIVGDATIEFRTHETVEAEYAYNYRRRTARIESIDDPSIFLESSAYTETDCGAPPDSEGNDVWCLVSHGLVGAHSLFPLIETHRPCESGLELLEAFALHSTSPTSFRVALATYPGALYEQLGVSSEEMAEQGMEAALIEKIDVYAHAAEQADQGYDRPEDNAKCAAALEEARVLLAPHLGLAAAWKADLVAARALAGLQRRYPYTLVGPRETFYDVVDTNADPWTVQPTAPPWSTP
ncbi:MAG: hypothetical protein K0V04_03635 [Deltaproteobacteria bacterium]|nr:hypothetical protein [Deltaproteobacteria bacterium]